MMFGDQRKAEILIHLLIAAFAGHLYADAAQIAPGPSSARLWPSATTDQSANCGRSAFRDP